MNCFRCSGLVVTEQVPADTIVLTVDRCINCGMRREHDLVPVPREAAAQGRPARTRCINCLDAPLPGFTQCAYHKQYHKQYHHEHKDKRPRRNSGVTQRRAVGPVWI
jgi:hypothetical protein